MGGDNDGAMEDNNVQMGMGKDDSAVTMENEKEQMGEEKSGNDVKTENGNDNATLMKDTNSTAKPPEKGTDDPTPAEMMEEDGKDMQGEMTETTGLSK